LPRFSIVVPAYQAASTLTETLDAILNQQYSDWECTVVDDGSTDDTFEIASSFAAGDPRFRVIRKMNGGTGSAYNAGVPMATGDFIVLCSADDVLLPQHLSTMSRFIDSDTGFDIYTSNGYVWRPGKSREPIYEEGLSEQIHSLQLADVIRVCFYGVGAAYRRAWFDKVGGYRTGIFGEDYDFWLRAMALGARHRYLPEMLSLFRVSPTQKSASLESVYQSDIRLVSDLRRDFTLDPKDVLAVAESIQERERLIADLGRPRRLYRDRLRPAIRSILFRLLGRQRARRWWRSLRPWV
jgi:glycosyltransferase involved in cell wall biosynthesis